MLNGGINATPHTFNPQTGLPAPTRPTKNDMTTIPERLTLKQAYLAMFIFLDKEYERVPSDELGGLLGSLQLTVDGMPMDPGAWEDWLDAVQKLSGLEDGILGDE